MQEKQSSPATEAVTLSNEELVELRKELVFELLRARGDDHVGNILECAGSLELYILSGCPPNTEVDKKRQAELEVEAAKSKLRAARSKNHQDRQEAEIEYRKLMREGKKEEARAFWEEARRKYELVEEQLFEESKSLP